MATSRLGPSPGMLSDWRGSTLAGMPITRNIAWDERLAAFKGRDTTDFVTVVGATATACGACGLPLLPEERLSLIVDVTEGTDEAGIEYLTFDTCLCHRRCRQPRLTLLKGGGGPGELAAHGARFSLEERNGTRTRTVPVLAYTLNPVLTFREPAGELTSALVSVLLAHGFRLSLTADYTRILQQTQDAGPDASCTVTVRGLVSFRIGQEQMYSHQLDPADVRDAEWLYTAAREGKILVISGDYLDITDSGLNLDAAARLGTLATGTVPFQT